jgi:hypothetical protein
MQRKRRIRNLGVALLLVGTGAVGVMVGAVLFMANPELISIPTRQPPTATTAPIPPTPTLPPAWVVTYEYRFGTTLGSGIHGYRLSVSCAGAQGSGSWAGRFRVDGDAPFRQNRVYVRPSGLWSAATGGDRVSMVNPNQLVGAAVSLEYADRQGAEAARETCQALVELDGGTQYFLEPAIPVERTSGG